MKSQVFLIAAIALAACAPRPKGPSPEAIQRYLATASERMNEDLKGRCISAYKDRMHDPSSFQQVDSLAPDDVATSVQNDPPAFGPPDGQIRVVFSARIRGRNAMGGLVLNKLYCTYELFGGQLIFQKAYSLSR